MSSFPHLATSDQTSVCLSAKSLVPTTAHPRTWCFRLQESGASKYPGVILDLWTPRLLIPGHLKLLLGDVGAVWQAGNTSVSGSHCKATWEAHFNWERLYFAVTENSNKKFLFQNCKNIKACVLQTIIQLIKKMWPFNSHLSCSHQRSKKIKKMDDFLSKPRYCIAQWILGNVSWVFDLVLEFPHPHQHIHFPPWQQNCFSLLRPTSVK